MPIRRLVQKVYDPPPPRPRGPLYWVALSDSNWNNPNNWSDSPGGAPGVGVPGKRNDAIFDSGSAANCAVDVDIECLDFTVNSTYSGNINFGTGRSHKISKDALFSGGGIIDLNDSAYLFSGDLDFSAQGTWNYSSSSIRMDGVDKSLFTPFGAADQFYNLTIEVGASVTWLGGSGTVTNVLLIKGELIIIAIFYIPETGDVKITSTGILTDDGSNRTFQVKGTLSQLDGIISCTNFDLAYGGDITDSGTIDADNFRINQYSGGSNYQFPASLRVNGDIFFATQTNPITLDFATDNTYLYVGGDVVLQENGGNIITWSKGTGGVSIIGSSNQGLDLLGKDIGVLILDKTGGISSLNSDVTVDFFNGASGSLDINGYTITIPADGDFWSNAGMSYLDTPNTGMINVGRNFNLQGSAGNRITWNGPNLNVGGTTEAIDVDVTNSNASAGNAIDATNNCTDNGGNVNWNFT